MQVGDVDLGAINIEITAEAKKGKNFSQWSAEREDQNINPTGKARIRCLEEK